MILTQRCCDAGPALQTVTSLLLLVYYINIYLTSRLWCVINHRPLSDFIFCQIKLSFATVIHNFK